MTPRVARCRERLGRRCGIAAAACLLAWAATTGPRVRGEDDRVVEDVPPGLEQPQHENRVDLGANFDTNLFQQAGGGFSLQINPRGAGDQGASSPAIAAARGVADKRLAQLEETCQLTDQQRRKLRLAMESDIRRLVDAVDAERRKYAGLQVNLNEEAGQRKWQQFQQDVQRCRERLQNVFDADSLFAKVLPVTLDESQAGRLAAEVRARRSYRWKTMVVATMAKLDDMLGLGQAQYETIERLLLAKEPPLRIEGPEPARHDQHARQMLVYMMLAEVDGRRLQEAVNERQWKTLSQLTNQGKAMKSYIEAQGLLEKQPQ